MTLEMNASPPPAQNAVVGAANAVASAATNAVNAVNSLLPFGNASPNKSNTQPPNPAENAPLNNMFSARSANMPANNSVVGVEAAPSTFGSFSMPTFSSPWLIPLSIFLVFLVGFILILYYYGDQIRKGYEYMIQYLRGNVGLSTQPVVVAPVIPIHGTINTNVTVPPVAPQTVTPKVDAATKSIVGKVLPSGSNEVFNVSQNTFEYYDAEPLCRALGAELATYEQVKDAWNKGADWCNYGWVKGQMAVYPTQEDTYQKLQAGPPEQRNACGTAGLNGGYFDNPEMKYGVNCYGKKPSQSAHDERDLMEKGKVPTSPSGLIIDEKIRQYREEADYLSVKPFNDSKWSYT